MLVTLSNRCVWQTCTFEVDVFACPRSQFYFEINAVFDDTSLASSFTVEVEEAEASVESTLESKVASTFATITVRLGELTVVNDDDGNDAVV